jgi:N-acetylmuramoyl-L-alanine amidase
MTTAAPLLRAGDRGAAVRDLQERLVTAGLLVRVDGEYAHATRQAVESFQAQRGLRVDGVCGPETWAALIESGFALGDRLMYLCQPMLRGDDVALLQRRLNALGFDAGREDGIFGRETEAALGAFQRDAGLATDRVCGPATLAALARLGSLAEGSVATVRERDTLRRTAQHLAGMRVFVAGDLEIAPLTSAVATGLRRHNAIVGLDNSGEDPSLVATSANRFLAGAFVALTAGAEPGIRCAYFANETFRSEGGFCLATRITEAIADVMPAVEPPIGRTYRLLRETRMAAVMCEVLHGGDADASSTLHHELPRLTNALVEGIRRGVEEPLDPPPRRER